jgi:hypothetical protein
MSHAGAPPRVITEAMRMQFNSSFHMLEKVVEVCPDSVWYASFYEDPFWYHVYHVSFFIDYWLRNKYDGSEFRCMTFDERIPPEFEHDIPDGLSISREDMAEFLRRVKAKTTKIFDNLDDARIALPITEGQSNYTYADVIAGQIRHIMYNIGYLNGILRGKGLEESDWYSYNEQEPQ